MGCGASKVSDQTVSPVENETNNEIKNNDISLNINENVLASSPPTSNTPIPSEEKPKTPPQIETKNELTNSNEIENENENENEIKNENKNENEKPPSSSEANVQEDNLQLKKSSSTTLGLEKSKSKSRSILLKSKSKSSLLEPMEQNNDEVSKENKRAGSSKSNSSSYIKNKELSSNNILNNKYGNDKKGLSQSSSEATLTNQNSSDSIGKLSLNSSFVPLPAIEPRTTLKSISFEIPLDESMICKTVRPSFKGSLPKLHISQDELKRKIGNVDSKWKDMNVTKNGYKKKGPVDEEKLKALKKRLLEKEAEAAMNRQRELDKLKAKLEKAQKHALKVQERKRKLEAEWMSKSKSNLEMQSNVNYIS